MTGFDLQRLEEAFTKACSLTSGEQRAAYLETLEAENQELASEVRHLLQALPHSDEFFEAPLDQRMRILMTTLGRDVTLSDNELEEFLESAQPPVEADELARLADQFALNELVAVGATGFVFRGWDCRLDRKVALKVLAPSIGREPKYREAFIDEARLASQINHPNVVTIYHVASGSEGDPNVYYVMEWVEGQDLQHRLSDSLKDLQIHSPHILSQLSTGISAVHRKGIVHRDIKPGNILIEDSTGRAVIIDFGLAFETGLVNAHLLPAGTPLYMSPEQITGEMLTDRSDQFSFAVVAFQLLTGEHPFSGKSVNELVENIRQANHRLESAGSTLNEAARAVFRRAFSASSDERFESVAAFYEQLSAAFSSTSADSPFSLGNETRPFPPPGQFTADSSSGNSSSGNSSSGNSNGPESASDSRGLGGSDQAGNSGRSNNSSHSNNAGGTSGAGGDLASGLWSPHGETYRQAAEGARKRGVVVGTVVLVSAVSYFVWAPKSAPTPSEDKQPGKQAVSEEALLLIESGLASGADLARRRRWVDANTMINAAGIEMKRVNAPAGTMSPEPGWKFPGHPEYTEEIDWRYYVENFYISTSPITFRQYFDVMGHFPKNNHFRLPHDMNLPITEISMRQAMAFCDELTRLDQSRHKYIVATYQQRSYAAYGQAMLNSPESAEEIETELLSSVSAESGTRGVDNRFPGGSLISRPYGGLWELVRGTKETYQELEGLVSLNDWGRRRYLDEYRVTGGGDEDFSIHWFDLNNGCNDHFVSVENLEYFLESDGTTSYLRPTEVGKRGSVTYRYRADGPITSLRIQPSLFTHKVGDECGIQIRARRSDSGVPFSEADWVDALKSRGRYINDPPLELGGMFSGEDEFEIRYWVMTNEEPLHYSQIFRGRKEDRELYHASCYVCWTSKRERPSIRATGPVPEHYSDPRITFRIQVQAEPNE